MTERVMGDETEYAAAVSRNGGVKLTPHTACSGILGLARTLLTHLPGCGGMFLENGGRLYQDVGAHPEFCTPEVDNPTDLVRYVLAGEAILRDLARALGKKLKAQVALFKSNVDYWQPGVTWAHHESYLHQADVASLPRHIVPFLASRIYCGAGGLNPLCPGIQFSLSPRVHIFVTDVSNSTTYGRGIYNTRDESLAGAGYRRLHVICSDSLCSHTSMWLKVATTCLVTAMAEADLDPGGPVQLADPVKALHKFATDPSFRATARLTDGRRLTAIQIQRHYQELAEAHAKHDCMPSWAGEACRRWRAMLDELERGPASVARKLDWAIKYPIFLDHLRRRGIDPDTLPHWNSALTQLYRVGGDKAERRLSAARILAARGPLRQKVRQLEPMLEAHGLRWKQVRDVLRVRAELCEIDMLFGRLDRDGIFEALEPGLDHRLPGVDRIDEAKTCPPQTTRARLRGKYVRRYAGKGSACAGWTHIRTGNGRRLDLTDPFGRDARWTRQPDMPPEVGVSIADVRLGYDRGEYERAYELVRSWVPRRPRPGPPVLSDFHIYEAWLLSRLGRVEEAVAVLDELAAQRGNDGSLAPEYVAVYRFQGLAPTSPEVRRWIDRADAFMERGCCGATAVACYLGHKGYVLARTGSLRLAEGVLRRACDPRTVRDAHQRVEARSMADLADVCRILGHRRQAARWLNKAEEIYASREFPGEEADFLLTYRAKLERDARRARSLLRRAKTVQTRFANRVGLARTFLLEARLTPVRATAARRREAVIELRDQVPDLGRCTLLARILDRWDEWANACRQPHPVTESGDFFWLL
jgi:proteasome accessory factor A